LSVCLSLAGRKLSEDEERKKEGKERVEEMCSAAAGKNKTL
jgi:hypothetical protein